MTISATQAGMPFNLHIEKQQRTQEAIETAVKADVLRDIHTRAHKAEEILKRQNYEQMVSYDKFGASNTALKPQGATVDLEI